MNNKVTYAEALRIGREVFGFGIEPEVGDYSYTFVSGVFKLQLMKRCSVPGQVYCRLETFTHIVGQAVGYFYYDLQTLSMTPIRKED